MTKRSPFRYFKTSPEIIRLAVMLYIRFPLSLRNVEDLLHERGIEISHETVRFWWNRFGPMFAAEIRGRRVEAMRACRQWQWHLDEVYVKINGVTHYLWRAVDHEGEVLESIVTKSRDRKAALKFLKKSMRRHGRPETIVTDRLRSYGAALKDLGRGDDREMGRAGSTTGQRTRTYRSDDARGRCCGSGVCERCRSSLQSMPQSTTTFQRSATSKIATPTRPPAPPLLPSGAAFSLPDRQAGLG
jgi:transposase-like protein